MKTQLSLLPVVLLSLLRAGQSIAFGGESATPPRTEQSPQLTISARFGLAGLHRIGDWMPIAVALKNDGPPVDLVVGVPLDPQPGVWTHVTMPLHSQKRIFLYVPLRGRDFLTSLAEESAAVGSTRGPQLRLEAYAGRVRVGRLAFSYQPTDRSTYALGLVGEAELPRSTFANRGVIIAETRQSEETPAPSMPRPALLLRVQPTGPQPSPLLTLPGSRFGQLTTGRSGTARMPPGWPRGAPSFSAESYRKLECAYFNLAVEDLPEVAAGLESLDCLAMTPSTLAKLSPAQRVAVRMWIEQGGAMLLFGGTPADVNGTSVAPLCPVRAIGERVVESLPSLAPWTLEFRRREGLAAHELPTGGAFRRIPDEPSPRPTGILPLTGRFSMTTVKAAPGANVELWEERDALLVTQSLGYGGIAYCNLPLSGEQIRQWPGAADLWLRALSALVERCQRARASDVSVRAVTPPHFASANLGDDPAVVGFLRRLRGVKPPPKWGVGVIAILYVLVFGPVNVWLVRRVRRSERGWLTTPALSVGFALFLLLCGFQWGGGSSVLTQFSLLECPAGATTAREETVFSIFSPAHGRYDFRFNDPCIFLDDKTAEEEERFGMTSNMTSNARPGMGQKAAGEVAERFAPSLDAAQWEQTARATAWRGAPIGVWTLRRLRATRAVALGGSVGLRYSRRPDGAIAECVVRNDAPFTLRDCWLAAGRARANVGELAPGATRTLTVDQWTTLQPGATDNSNFAPGLDVALRELLSQLSATLGSRAGGVTLFARHDDPLLRIETGHGPVHRAYGLLVVHAPAPP